VITLFVTLTLVFRSQAAAVFDAIQTGIFTTAGWFYILSANVFIAAILYFALGKFGTIRLGGAEATLEFSDLSWMAMLFSAGMGIGLMFFSVAEPIFHFGTVPPFFGGVEGQTAAAGSAAMATTFFDWGLHSWAIYALVGLGLAFFSFNRGLPLTFRSIFWPLLGERIYGWPGHVIDVLSVMATLFGLSTSLGIGVQQINAGLAVLSSQCLPVTVPQATWVQVVLIAIATLSVAAGLGGGVRRLSEANLYLMLLLLGLMVVVGPTLYLLGTFVSSIGVYVGVLPELAFWTETAGSRGGSAAGRYSTGAGGYRGRRSSGCSSPASRRGAPSASSSSASSCSRRCVPSSGCPSSAGRRWSSSWRRRERWSTRSTPT